VGAKCPIKNLGAKCFACNERGHIASKCPKKTEVTKTCLVATRSASQKYTKDILIQGRQIKALIDSGSDLTLMRADEYMKLEFPQLRLDEMRFRGVRYQYDLGRIRDENCRWTFLSHMYMNTLGYIDATPNVNRDGFLGYRRG